MTDKKKPTFDDFRSEVEKAYEEEKKRLLEERKQGTKLFDVDPYEEALMEERIKLRKERELQESGEKETLEESIRQLDELERTDPRMGSYVGALQRSAKEKERMLPEDANLLGGQDAPVTRGDLQKAISTSLASLGGGGAVRLRELLDVKGTPDNGDMLVYNGATGNFEYSDSSTLANITATGIDSAAAVDIILTTVDSDYVTSRLDAAVANALDSNLIVQLVDSYIDSDFIQLHVKSTTFVPEGTNLYYTTARHDSDTLVLVDSAYVEARVTHYNDSDVISLLRDSGVHGIIPQADSTYDLGSPTRQWKDLYLSGSTIHLGSIDLKSGGDDGTGLYVDGRKLAYADSLGTHYATADHDSDTLVQVDSAYVQLRVKSTTFVPEGTNLYYTTSRHDSDTLVQVDSAYVQLRQIKTVAGLTDTQIDSLTIATDDFLRWNGTQWIASPFNVEPGLQFQGSIDATVDSAPSQTGGYLYVNTGSGVVGASWTGIVGDSIDSGQSIAWADSDARWYILGNVNEGGVVEVRQGNGISIDDSTPSRPFVAINRTVTDTWYLDSARTIAMIDSAYVNLRSDHYTTANHDSDTLVQVDSAYIQARQIKYLDSAQITNLIDSAYVAARDSDGGFYTTADHDSDTLVQVDSAYITARADDTYVNVTGDTMTGTLVIDSANLTINGGGAISLNGGGNVGIFGGSLRSNTLNSVGNSNLNIQRNAESRLVVGVSDIRADKKIRYNQAITKDSYTSDLVGVDSYTLMPKWYVDAGVNYTTANHDSDTLAQVDSAYVAARVTFPAGSIVAGGRFITNSSFAYDSVGAMPSRWVKNQFGISNIVRIDAGEYQITFDSANDLALADSYSYIVTATLDYNADNPTASARVVSVYNQTASTFTLLSERTDDGTNQDYGTIDGGARINFTVTKA